MRILAVSSDGSKVLFESRREKWRVRSENTQNSLVDFDSPIVGAARVQFSQDGSRVWAIGNGKLSVWDSESGKSLWIHDSKQVYFRSAALSPSGDTVALGSIDGTVRLLAVGSGRLLRTFKKHKAMIRSLEFSFDGNMIVSTDSSGSTRVWNTRSGKELASVQMAEYQQEGNRGVSFLSPDGKRLITTSGLDNPIVQIWDLRDGALVAETSGIKYFEHETNAFAFSPSGDKMAVVYDHSKLKILNLDDGSEFATFNHSGAVDPRIAFSSDGRKLTSVGVLSTLEIQLNCKANTTWARRASANRRLALTEEQKKSFFLPVSNAVRQSGWLSSLVDGWLPRSDEECN